MVSSVTIVMYFIYVTTFSAAGPKRLLWVINQNNYERAVLYYWNESAYPDAHPCGGCEQVTTKFKKPTCSRFWIGRNLLNFIFYLPLPPVRAQELLGHRLGIVGKQPLILVVKLLIIMGREAFSQASFLFGVVTLKNPECDLNMVILWQISLTPLGINIILILGIFR